MYTKYSRFFVMSFHVFIEETMFAISPELTTGPFAGERSGVNSFVHFAVRLEVRSVLTSRPRTREPTLFSVSQFMSGQIDLDLELGTATRMIADVIAFTAVLHLMASVSGCAECLVVATGPFAPNLSALVMLHVLMLNQVSCTFIYFATSMEKTFELFLFDMDSCVHFEIEGLFECLSTALDIADERPLIRVIGQMLFEFVGIDGDVSAARVSARQAFATGVPIPVLVNRSLLRKHFATEFANE